MATACCGHSLRAGLRDATQQRISAHEHRTANPPRDLPRLAVVGTLRGVLLALALGVLLGASGLVTSVVGAGWWWAPIGIVAGGLAYGMMKSYCELVRVIASTLLPD